MFVLDLTQIVSMHKGTIQPMLAMKWNQRQRFNFLQSEFDLNYAIELMENGFRDIMSQKTDMDWEKILLGSQKYFMFRTNVVELKTILRNVFIISINDMYQFLSIISNHIKSYP